MEGCDMSHGMGTDGMDGPMAKYESSSHAHFSGTCEPHVRWTWGKNEKTQSRITPTPRRMGLSAAGGHAPSSYSHMQDAAV